MTAPAFTKRNCPLTSEFILELRNKESLPCNAVVTYLSENGVKFGARWDEETKQQK